MYVSIETIVNHQKIFVALKRAVCFGGRHNIVAPYTAMWGAHTSLGRGVLGDRLGTFTDGVLGELTGQQEPHGGLHLPGGDRRTLVVVGETRRFRGDTLEDVVHERVHD